MIIVLVYFKDRSTRLGLRNGQVHRKRLFKEINMLLQERSTLQDAV